MEQEKKELSVKYHNDLNNIKTTQLTEVDLNVFFSLCAKAKEKNSTEVRIDFDTFLYMSGLKNKSTVNTRRKMINFIDKKYEILRKLEYKSKTDRSLKRFPLINKLWVNEDDDFIMLRIDDEFLYILNTEKDFTKFILSNFVGINGKYAKNLYRLLMRYDDTGWADYTLDDFKDFMGIPEGYRAKDVVDKIIKKSVDELIDRGLMTEIRYEIKRSHRKGNEIKGFHFDFKTCVNDDMPGQTGMSDANTEMSKYKALKDKERSKYQFNNFPQNSYDFTELEEKLLDN